ncbi:MAG: hypothetical protein ACO28V_05250 [Chitinophagaceae bacterium]|jgi:hypothetical protein
MTPEELAAKSQELKQMYDAGQLNETEFKELVCDLIIVHTINNAALELEENITCREIILGVINFASAIA